MGPIQTFGELRAMLRRRAVIIVLVTLVGSALAVLQALNLPREYSASATIRIESPVIDEQTASGANSLLRRIQVIEQELMARESALRIIREFDLFADTGLTDSEKVAQFRGTVDFRQVVAPPERPGERGAVVALVVSAQLDEPDRTVTVVNALADEILEQGERRRRGRSEEVLRFFAQEEARLGDEIEELESEIADFQTANEDVLPGALEARRDEVERLRAAALEVERRLASLRRELAAVEQENLRATAQRRIDTLQDEISNDEEQLELLRTRIAEVESQISRAPDVQRQLRAYERRLEQQQDRFMLISRRRAEAEIGQRLETGGQGERLEILERAVPPDYPSGPSRRNVAGAGGMASLGAALLLAFLLELRNPVIRTAAQMQREVGIRPVVTIPYVESPNERRRRHLWRVAALIVLTVVLFFAAWAALSS